MTSTAEPLRASSISDWRIFAAAPASTPHVGWLTTITVGLRSSSRPMMNFCRLPPESAAASGSRPLLRTSISSMMRCVAASMAPVLDQPAGADETPWRRWHSATGSRFSDSFMRGAAPWPSRSSGTKAAPSMRRPVIDSLPASLPRMRIVPASSCMASPETASKNSPCPLPATPAMPMTSPARTLSDDVAQRDRERRRRLAAKSADLEQRLGLVHALDRLAHDGLHLVADHHAGERGRRLLARIAMADHLAVAQHGGAVAHALHLFEAVRDVEDRLAFGAQPLERLEQLVGLLRRQHRGRLVEDDQVRRLQQAADDLDALALADRQVADQRIGIERQAVAVGQRLRLGGDRADRRVVVERQRDVLGRRQRLEQRKMLENHADAELLRDARAG